MAATGDEALAAAPRIVHRHLVRLRAEEDAERWLAQPPREDESSLSRVVHWGSAEDWRDREDAAR